MVARAKIKLFDQGRSLSVLPSQPRTYLDFNATAPLRPAVREAVLAQLDRVGNPSSVHAEGRAARAAVEAARAAVGALAGVPAHRVTFTSGATEAATLALHPGLADHPGQPEAARLLLGATEHAALRQGHRFPADRVDVVPVDGQGIIDLHALKQQLARPGRAIVAIQVANGETGVVQPIAAIAARVKEAGGLLVTDAVQAAGRLDITAAVLGADVVLVSSHKIGGPQGAGALVAVRDGLVVPPVQRGGGQERGVRGGTENVAGLAGFGVAARLVADGHEAARLAPWRDALEAQLKIVAPDAVVFGAGVARLPNTLAFAIPGIANDAVLIGLDLKGFAVSTGSACSSGKVSRAEVLEAMGVDRHLRGGMIRVSLGWSTTADHVTLFSQALAIVLRPMQMRCASAAA